MNKISPILFLLSFWTGFSQNKELKLLEEKDRQSMNEISNLFFKQSKENEAYEKALKLMKKGHSDSGKSLATSLISSYFSRMHSLDSAVYYAEKTLAYKNFSTDSIQRKRYIMGSMNLATGYFAKGIIDKAKKIYIEGIQKAEEWGDTKNYYGFIVNLGNLYYLNNEYEKALELYKKGSKSPENRVKMMCNSSMGNVYASAFKNYEKSNEYYSKALLQLNGNLYFELSLKLNIAHNLLKIGRKEEGVKEFKNVIKESEKLGYYNQGRQAKEYLIEVYIESEKYQKAENLLMPLLKDYKKKGNLKDELDAYAFLRKIKEGKKAYQDAFSYSEKYIKLKDSINKLQHEKEINELEVKFETLQKEKEIVVLKKNEELKDQEIEQQAMVRNIILIASILIIIAILLLVRFYFQKLKTQQKLNKAQEEFNYQKIKALMKKQELELVKASIEGQDNERKRLARGLHDSIGNNMAAIKLQFETLPEGSEKLNKIKNDLSDTYEQVRELSHNLLPRKIRQNDYAEVLHEYIKNIDEISDLKINFSVTEKEIINQTDKYLQSEIFSILQELISNTLKHANAKTIDIQLEVIEETIYLSYEDDGVGFDTSKLHSGIGLANMKDRVAQLSGTCIIDSHPKRGTLFRMEVDKDMYLISDVV
ncbi:sensor histidine kinase [uncultured Tenacibaculum sp.]|uniref:tetratricopeptide repeat-containing sensor histidine kinase n=1 Tax=uncultured Tenacibaculum sp. TaxID=174713 RepID=UPI0026130C4E|nr:sensor histidine kinase [uncultured Tenacibaculum sp.]